MRTKYFYLEFQIESAPRFQALHRLFDALKDEKSAISDSSAEDEDLSIAHWRSFLDDGATKWFEDTFDFDGEEGQTFHQLWTLTDPEIRREHPMFRVPGNWDFETMIQSIFDGEYALVDLTREEGSQAVLFYDPWAGPFGGSEPLVALLESFGNTVSYDSWHKGPPRREASAWDYPLARRLVAAGSGLDPTH